MKTLSESKRNTFTFEDISNYLTYGFVLCDYKYITFHDRAGNGYGFLWISDGYLASSEITKSSMKKLLQDYRVNELIQFDDVKEALNWLIKE